MWEIIIQSGHNFVQVTAAELPQHVQNSDFIGSLESKLEQREF